MSQHIGDNQMSCGDSGETSHPCREYLDPVGIEKRSDAVIEGLVLVLEHHHCSHCVLAEMKRQVRNYLTVTDESVWLKRAKYLLTYPLAKYLRNDLPPSPDVSFAPSGPLRGWMKPRLNAFNRRNTHLWSSWLQTKRSALPVSLNVVKKSYDDHLSQLTEEFVAGPTVDQIMTDPTFLGVLDHVRDSVQKRVRELDRWRETFPTQSACWESTRFSGGQLATLQRLCGIDPNEFNFHTELYEMRYARFHGRNGHVSLRVVEKRRVPGKEYWDTLADFGEDREVRCLVQAILEPLKVRVITKEEALPGYMARPLQRILHDTLRSMPCFRLIGRPLCPTDLMDLDRRDEGAEWFSIDYSAATDGLSWEYSRRILAKILPEDRRFPYERVLGPHKLYYPIDLKGGSCFANRRLGGLQKNGQLMGSILSFPILCLANLGLYLAVTRGEFRDRLKRVLINGDDMLYKAKPEVWDRHVRMGLDVGLKMSVGKAYHHAKYANINSTSFHCPSGDTPWQINYLNTGLFFNRRKVQGKEGHLPGCVEKSQDADDGIVGNLNILLEGSLPGRQRETFNRYLAMHKERIREELAVKVRMRGKLHSSVLKKTKILNENHKRLRTDYITSRNIWIPCSLGGAGVRPWPFVRYTRCVTRIQRLIATFHAQSASPRPFRGYETEEYCPLTSTPWFRFGDNVKDVVTLNATTLTHRPALVEHRRVSSCQHTFH